MSALTLVFTWVGPSGSDAILLIFEDIDEIIGLSDRIAVTYEGRIMDIVARGQATPAALGLLMSGVAGS